jgi:hypothetical protein
MKKNFRSIIALLLIMFNISVLFENNIINTSNPNGISTYSDDDIISDIKK